MESGPAAHDETKAIRKATAKHSPSAHRATNRSCSPRLSTAVATRAGSARAGTTATAAVTSRNRNPPARRKSRPAGRCSSSFVARAATAAAPAAASRGRSRSGAGRFATGRLCEVVKPFPGSRSWMRARCTRCRGGLMERVGGGGGGGGTALAAGGGGGAGGAGGGGTWAGGGGGGGCGLCCVVVGYGSGFGSVVVAGAALEPVAGT
jgi:hypothetical protein